MSEFGKDYTNYLSILQLIALNDIDLMAVVAEIKRQRKKLSITGLAGKVASISDKLAKYKVSLVGLSMEEM